MSITRDNFTTKTIDILAKRVGYFCSNPQCRQHTVGPNAEKKKATIVGIAAHITAASPKGPRYDPKKSAEDRRDIENGIWLCPNCSILIDKDPDTYSVDLLIDWKSEAEASMIKQLKGEKHTKEKPFLEADLIWVNSQRWNKGLTEKNRELYGNELIIGTDKPVIHWLLIWNFNIVIYNNSKYPAYNIKVEKITEANFDTVDKLNKVNNLPPYADLRLNAKLENYFEGFHTEADKILKPKVPEFLQNSQIRITYLDEDRNEQSTLCTIVGEEIINEKEE